MVKTKIRLTKALLSQINDYGREETLNFLLMHSLVGSKKFWDKWTKKLYNCYYDELTSTYQTKQFKLALKKLFWDKIKEKLHDN